MMKREILEKAGVNYAKGLERYLNDAEFYEEVLRDFENEDAYERAEVCLQNNDINGLLNAMHELKGVSGNVDMTELYQSSSEVVALIRGGARLKSELETPMLAVRAAYLRAKQGLADACQD